METSRQHSSEFLIFLLTGDRVLTQEILSRTRDCKNDDELIKRLKELGVISVGMSPYDEYTEPPDRPELIDGLIRECFVYKQARWARAM